MKREHKNEPQGPIKPLPVKMLLDKIIVRPAKIEDEKRDSGIVITEEMKKMNINLPRFGRVVAAGPGDPNRNGGAMTVKVGDLVCFLFYSGTPFEFGGHTHLIMREFDISFIVEE